MTTMQLPDKPTPEQLQARIDSAGDRCKHPLGFTVLRTEQMCCFDCGAPTPGRCVCGALYQTPQCQTRGHLRGPQLDTETE